MGVEVITQWISGNWAVAIAVLLANTAMLSPAMIYVIRILSNRKLRKQNDEQKTIMQHQTCMIELLASGYNKMFQSIEILVRTQGNKGALEKFLILRDDHIALEKTIREKLQNISPESQALVEAVKDIPVLLAKKTKIVKEVLNNVDTNKVIL